VQNGDAPYFKNLADEYAMSDNFHQSVNGGTGANHIMLGHGDAIWFSALKQSGTPDRPHPTAKAASKSSPPWQACTGAPDARKGAGKTLVTLSVRPTPRLCILRIPAMGLPP
jgi:hypothetical protein